MTKGLGEGEEVAEEEEEERKAGMTTAEEERGRREKVQREAEVGVLREAEQVGRWRKVSVSCWVQQCWTVFCVSILPSIRHSLP